MSNVKNLLGMKFGKLTVVQFMGTKNYHSIWKCMCDCGKFKELRGYCLTTGLVKSCGCIAKEHGKELGLNNRKHYFCEVCGNAEHYANKMCRNCYNRLWKREKKLKNNKD